MPMDSAEDQKLGAAELGLADYQYRLYLRLLDQVDERGVPREAALIIARWIDRLDFGPLLASTREVSEVLGVSYPTLNILRHRHPHWLEPLVEPLKADGVMPIISLWLRDKVEGFRRYREAERSIQGPAKE